MPLTRNFKDTVLERAQNDSEFRIGLLTEAAECLLNNELDVAKALIRDYINATLGFAELASIVDKKPTSIMRMLSKDGNPSIENMSKVLAAIHQHEGIKLRVSAA